ncbi:MFS transporter [Actinoplanes sp. SE50/110]|uniref:MFS transporter n=2 Tax=Actinoplanes TaxID=1865 RepID=UPI003511E293
MWVIATEQLHLPKVFAVLVFAVFEICFLTATSLAAEQYRNTSVYAPDGRIETPGHPGPMLWIAALIAAVSGIIVASNAVTGTEKLLRLAVPCVIFLMWWAALTAAGQRVRRGRFAYSPRRLAERWGWLIPDDDPDLERMAAERQMRRMVVNHHRVSSGRWPKAWWRSRLLKDARTAGEPVVEDVVEQLARIQRVMDLLAPGSVRIGPIAGAAPMPASPVSPARPAQVTPPPPAAEDQPAQPSVTQPMAPVNAAAPALAAGSHQQRPTAPVTPDEMLKMTTPETSAEVPTDRTSAWAAIPTTSVHHAATIVGSPWWRLAVERLAWIIHREITPDDLPRMTYSRLAEQITSTTLRVPELGRGVVEAFVNDYIRAMNGEPGKATYPWRDLLPQPVTTPVGSELWKQQIGDLRVALINELDGSDETDPRELAMTLAPTVPRLDDATLYAFVNDYVCALGGHPVSGDPAWQHLLPHQKQSQRASPRIPLPHRGAEGAGAGAQRQAVIAPEGHGQRRAARRQDVVREKASIAAATPRPAAVTHRVPQPRPAGDPQEQKLASSPRELREQLADMMASGQMETCTEKWKRETARQLYRDITAAGERITGTDLAALFGRDPRWGQRRKEDVDRGRRTQDVARARNRSATKE